ncbi:MAG: 50S ribosomal protein L11 methyltransferase [Spirochaetes bacterium]|nr:50S ribosomal protein L11 methyltransferase [Spirochaetota bacterium]
MFEEILWGLGASSISIDTENKTITAVFDNPDHDKIIKTAGKTPVSAEVLEEDDWKNLWFEKYSGVKIENFHILPFTLKNTDSVPDDTENGIPVYLDPRESFGSGEHPSTILAIRLFHSILKKYGSEFSKSKNKILDIGTGSGILSIIAEKSGADSIYAVDTDENACRKAEYNFQINNCRNIRLLNIEIQNFIPDFKFDIIFSNILCELHEKIIHQYLTLLSDTGYLIISGITGKWSSHLFDLLSENGFSLIESASEAEWQGGIFIKNRQNLS